MIELSLTKNEWRHVIESLELKIKRSQTMQKIWTEELNIEEYRIERNRQLHLESLILLIKDSMKEHYS